MHILLQEYEEGGAKYCTPLEDVIYVANYYKYQVHFDICEAYNKKQWIRYQIRYKWII